MPGKLIRLLFLSCLFLLLTTCAGILSYLPFPSSSNNASERPYLSSFPTADGLVFIGVATKRSDPKETLLYALQDAARRVAAYHQISGEYLFENNVGSGAFDYTNNTTTTLTYDEKGAARYVDALKFDADTDTLEMENTFFIRTVYPASLPVPVRYSPTYSNKDNKPGWIENPPNNIEGYEVAVGFSGRYSSMYATLINAFNNSVFAIIRSINAYTRSSDMLYQETGSLFGYKTANNNAVYSYGTLNNFYILDTWIDPENKTVWTLAIAKKP